MQPIPTYRVIQGEQYYYMGEDLMTAMATFAALMIPLLRSDEDIIRVIYTEHTIYKTPVISASVLHTPEEKISMKPPFLTVFHGCTWEDWEKWGPKGGFPTIEEVEQHGRIRNPGS